MGKTFEKVALTIALAALMRVSAFNAINTDRADGPDRPIAPINVIVTEQCDTPSLIELVAEAEKSTVYVDSEFGSGSGVVIGVKTVLTAKHVADMSADFTVKDYLGNEYWVLGKWIHKNSDCAVLYLDRDVVVPVAKLADSDLLVKGEMCFTVGSPYSFDYFNSATIGIVSNTNVFCSYFGDRELLLIDAETDPGNSGGPVFNRHGEIIGIVVGCFSQYGNTTLVVPSNVCKDLENDSERANTTEEERS